MRPTVCLPLSLIGIFFGQLDTGTKIGWNYCKHVLKVPGKAEHGDP